MAVEHNMAELDSAWWDLLQKIVVTLNWDYAALWTSTNDGRNLFWKQGYFHNNMRSHDDPIRELFYSLYGSCNFTPGVGFAGHALEHKTNSILWLTGDELESLEHPVARQTYFLTAAGIQTIVCLPLGFPSSSFVLELGTVNRVRESEDLAHNIKKILLHLLAGGLPHLIMDNPVTAMTGEDQLIFHERTRAFSHPHPSSSLAMVNEHFMESPRTSNALSFSPSSLEGEMLLKAQRQLQSSIYSELMQPIEQDEPFHDHMQVAQGILNVGPPQLSVEIPEVAAHGSPEPSSGGSLISSSPWAAESSLFHMDVNALQSWTSMAEATSALDIALHGIPGTTSVTSSRLAGEIVDLNNDGMEQILPPFSTSPSLDQFMVTAADDQRQQQIMMGAASLRGSSSRSSVSMRSQTVEDTAISSTILESYANCHISEFGSSSQRVRAVNTAVMSSSTTAPTESENSGRGGAHDQRSSGPSSKETSPESYVPPPRHGHGIHPRISFQKQQQHGSGSVRAADGSHGQQQRLVLERLERQHSNSLIQNTNQQQEEDLKPAASGQSARADDDSSPRLVQFGNVLQLGNAAGQVTEALPQEHDEAAVSHMLAERRRRNKQNENFTQLKFLIPSAAKMDKAAVLAATITYIHELKERVKDLEQNNQSLKHQLLGQEQVQTSSEGLLKNIKVKGSPTRVRVRSPNSLSPTDSSDKIQASPDGDGNLKIDIRNPCSQPDIAIHIFACLKDLHFKVINANVAINDNRIHASIIVKMKRKNSTAQSEVCAEVEQALTICLNN